MAVALWITHLLQVGLGALGGLGIVASVLIGALGDLKRAYLVLGVGVGLFVLRYVAAAIHSALRSASHVRRYRTEMHPFSPSTGSAGRLPSTSSGVPIIPIEVRPLPPRRP